MKSKLFKQHQKEKDKELKQSGIKNEENADEHQSDVEAGNTGVASGKNSKVMVIIASAVLITLVIYFIFF